MIFLVDYNLDGYAVVFLGVLAKRGWLQLLPIRFVTFKEADLQMDVTDRILWNYAQQNEILESQDIKPSDFEHKLANLPESSLVEGYLILEPTETKVIEAVI